MIVDRIFDVVLRAPSRDIVDNYVDLLVGICMHMPPHQKQIWFSSVFSRTPGNVLTDEEKQSHLIYLVGSHKKNDGLIENFDIIAKRARNASNRAN